MANPNHDERGRFTFSDANVAAFEEISLPKKALTGKQGSAKWWYSEHGATIMNESLRDPFGRGKDSFTGKPHYTPASQEIVNLDAAIKRNKLDRDIGVYRGTSAAYKVVTSGGKQVRIGDLKPGDEFHDPGYTSTSAAEHVAKKFRARGAGALMQVTVTKGVGALPITHKQEHEFVLPRAQRMRVTAVKRGKSGPVLSVTTIKHTMKSARRELKEMSA